jgi:glycosyltransferase involved in cell wall biosynthesis
VASALDIALLTAGRDRPYAFGLATALLAQGIRLDFIASDELDSPEFHGRSDVAFLSLRGDRRADAPLIRKMSRVLMYYARLVRYAASARPKIFHILWNNKFETIDRTLLMAYYRLLGKQIVLTLHNVNAGTRDGNDTFLNRLTLKIQYRWAHHIFVHTRLMKDELIRDFGLREFAVTVIPYGINNLVPDTAMTREQARLELGIQEDERTILFFGNIAPYKGLEYLVDAVQSLAQRDRYRLVIAGSVKRGADQYWAQLKRSLDRGGAAGRILQRIDYIPDEKTEVYFKACDVAALPYTHIFQSGVLFLAYNFGLPVIVSDVGSMKEDVLEGKTGFVFEPRNSADLAATIEKYFASDLFANLNAARHEIRQYANLHHSWSTVAGMTRDVYAHLLAASLVGGSSVSEAG